jgi:bifunctional non-homologous end joining protein LigD
VPRGTHWCRPELVVQIGFAEWTTDGRLRQPRYLGLRDDMAPGDVVRERPR